MSTKSRGSDFKRLSIILLELLIVINRSECIDYAANRQDTIPPGRTRENARTTRNILEELNHRNASRTHNLQDGTEHLLQYGALLRTQILDTFGKLVYDHYDDFGTTQIESLYRIYRETLERKYNIFAIIPSLLKDPDTRPTKICAHINEHVRTCLKESSRSCMNINIHNEPHEDTLSKPALNVTREIYQLSEIPEHYPNGFSLDAVLSHLRAHRLYLTPELFSGLLHNVQYDSFDDRVRAAERELVFFLTKTPKYFKNISAKIPTNAQSVSRFLQNYLSNGAKIFRGKAAEYAEYLAEHVVREVDAVSENIELLGTIYDNSTINLKYLFELILSNDTVDRDIVEARDYLLRQIKEKRIVQTHLQVEKYQQAGPDQLLMEILGQLRDIKFAEDLVSSLHVHARFWHKSHMIENPNALLELFDAYENLRGIPEYGGLLETMDRIKTNLRDSKNVTVELLCSRPRACLRIGLEIVANCGLINNETKRAIELFIGRTTCGCSCLNEDPETVTESGTSVDIGVEIITESPAAIDASETDDSTTETTEESPENISTSMNTTTESFEITTESMIDSEEGSEEYEDSSEETPGTSEETAEVPSTIPPGETQDQRTEKPCEGDCHLGDCNGTDCSPTVVECTGSDCPNVNCTGDDCQPQGNCTGPGCTQGKHCEGSECQDSEITEVDCDGSSCESNISTINCTDSTCEESTKTKCLGSHCSENSCEGEKCESSSTSECEDEDCTEEPEQLPTGLTKKHPLMELFDEEASSNGTDCPEANCEGLDCPNADEKCKGEDCFSSCQGDDCQDNSSKDSCEGTDCSNVSCEGPDCKLNETQDCEGSSCSDNPIDDKCENCLNGSSCEGDVCQDNIVGDDIQCEGPGCSNISCINGKCEPNSTPVVCGGPNCTVTAIDVNCKGPHCPKSTEDCEGPDCRTSQNETGSDCEGADCKNPEVDKDCQGLDCPIDDKNDGNQCEGSDCPEENVENNCNGADCSNSNSEQNCDGQNCVVDENRPKVDCKGIDCPPSEVSKHCEGPDCPTNPDNTIIDCEGTDCPVSKPEEHCEGADCPASSKEVGCKGADCPESEKEEGCKGTDCPESKPEQGCEGPDCPASSKEVKCEGADCPASSKEVKCEGADCLASKPGQGCDGPDCPASSKEVKCDGADCSESKSTEEIDCEGADCPASTEEVDCEGADCPASSKVDCKGADCSASTDEVDCKGLDCPAPEKEDCKGSDCQKGKGNRSCEGAACAINEHINQTDCGSSECPSISDDSENPCKSDDCSTNPKESCQGEKCSTAPSTGETTPTEDSTTPTITLSPVIELIHPNRTTFCDNSDPHYRRKLNRLQKMRRIDVNSSTSRIETWGAIFAASSFVSETSETTEEIVSDKENRREKTLFETWENSKSQSGNNIKTPDAANHLLNDKTAPNSHEDTTKILQSRNQKKNIWSDLRKMIDSQSEEKVKEDHDGLKDASPGPGFGPQRVVHETGERNRGGERSEDLSLEKIIPSISFLKRVGKVRSTSWTGSEQKSREMRERRDSRESLIPAMEKDFRSNSGEQIQKMINGSDMRKVSGGPIKRVDEQVPIIHQMDSRLSNLDERNSRDIVHFSKRDRNNHEELRDNNNKYDHFNIHNE